MKKYLFILLIPLFFLTGCSYRELNELAIVSTIGVDYQDNKYIISAQVVNVSKAETASDEAEETTLLYVGEGPTVLTAVRDIYNKYPKNIHLAHLELVVLGKDVVSKDVTKVLNYFITSPEATGDAKIIVNKSGTAMEILDPINKNPDSYNGKAIINNLIQNERHEGVVCDVNMKEFLSWYYQKGIDPIIPSIEYVKSEDGVSNIMLLGFVVFKNDDIIGSLSKKASIAYNLINANFIDIAIKTNYEGQDLTIILIEPKSDIEIEIKDNKLKFKIKISATGHISEIYSDIDLTDKKILNKMSDNYENTIKGYIQELLDFSKENNVDVLGLKNMIYKKKHKYYEQYKDENIYEVADIDIDIDVNLFRHGTTYIGVRR